MELADLQGSNHEHQLTEINEQTMTQGGRQLFGRRNIDGRGDGMDESGQAEDGGDRERHGWNKKKSKHEGI